MLSEKQISEIKEHLEKAQNPLFFFDNDGDGLCSFLLLARALGKGKGVAIKSFPELNESYSRKLYELSPDYVFILDKPIVSHGFLEETRKLNIPVVWIDHHNLNQEIPKDVYYYNPTKNEDRKSEPVTYLCWKIVNNKKDLWLAVVGCISDNFMPEFFNEFCERYDLCEEGVKTAFGVLYETEIGKIARILSFALKDRTSKVIKMLKFLLKVKNPREILAEENNQLLFRFNQINKKYQQLIGKAKKLTKGRLVYFQYGGELSLSGEIANELYYRFPNKIVVVAYIKGTKANISVRGKNAREITLKAIENLEGATGGGHEQATGAKVNLEDLPKFKERIENLVK